MNEPSNVECIHRTLKEFDPDQTTICIGGAAINLQLEQAGVEYPATSDVDVMCSQVFYTNLLNSGSTRFGDKFCIRTFTRPTAQGIDTHEQIDVLPANRSLLKFTAVHSAAAHSPHPTDFEAFNNKMPLTVVDGITCVELTEIFVWMAAIGRRKDMAKLDKLLPRVIALGILNDERLDKVTTAMQSTTWKRQ